MAAAPGLLLLLTGLEPSFSDSEAVAVIGTKVSPTSMDPQLGGLGSDQGYYRHLYDALFLADVELQPQPALAISYRNIDDLTWEFELRRGVRYHDGTPFDAGDVLYSFERLGTVPGSDGLQEEKMRPVVRIEALDLHTIRIHTRVPTPYLLRRLVEFWIMSDSLPTGVTTGQLNRGQAIGTGPFRLVEWKRGNQLELARNRGYWGEAPDFDRVIFREMHNDATRVAALQAGDVDMIDYVPPLDTFRLNRMSKINVFSKQSARVIFIQLATLKSVHPDVTDRHGKALEPNPLRDNRVRRALKLAINKALIIEKVLENTASRASQAVPEGFEGFNPAIKEEPFDPQRARLLLAQAGYPEGFRLRLSCPNDRYINDSIVCQAIGQLWTQVGVVTDIDTMPKSVYFTKMLAGEFAAWMLGWGNTRGDSISVLKNVIHGRDTVRGGGTWNASYANPELDAAIDRAITLMDPNIRRKELTQIMSRAMQEHVMIPLYTQPVIVATRSGLSFTPVPGEETLAILLRRD